MARAFWALSSPKNSAKSLNWRIRSDGWYVGIEAMEVITSKPSSTVPKTMFLLSSWGQGPGPVVIKNSTFR